MKPESGGRPVTAMAAAMNIRPTPCRSAKSGPGLVLSVEPPRRRAITSLTRNSAAPAMVEWTR